MTYQIICDNCAATVAMKPDRWPWPKPAAWEAVPLSAREDGITKHLCADCARVKELARFDMMTKTQRAQEEALAARRPKP